MTLSKPYADMRSHFMLTAVKKMYLKDLQSESMSVNEDNLPCCSTAVDCGGWGPLSA